MSIEESNAALRTAVQQRREAQAACTPREEWYGEATPERHDTTPSYLRASDEPSRAERTLHDAMEAVRDRHTKYGPPTSHFARTARLVNAAFGTTFTGADWALVMVLDKVSRQLGDQQTDDAAVDIAGYAACHQECRDG